MQEINNVKIMLGLQMLLDNNMELLSKHIEIYRSLYKTFKDIEQDKPQLVKTKWSLEEWNKKLDAHLKSREDELLELHNNIMKILGKPFVFYDLYQHAISVLKTANEFSVENFLIPEECREEFESVAKIAAPLLSKSQNFSLSNIDLISKKMGEKYNDFLLGVYIAAISHICVYFDKIFRQHNINIKKWESSESIIGKFLETSKNNPQFNKILLESLIQFDLANKLEIRRSDFITSFHIGIYPFDILKQFALEIDNDLKKHPKIQRINYLSKNLDCTVRYIPDYCAFDTLTWLQSKEEIDDVQPKTKLENFQDFQALHWNYSENLMDFLESNLQLSKQFLKFGYYVAVNYATAYNTRSYFFDALYKDLKIVFDEHELNNVCIQINTDAETTLTLCLKKQVYFYFRDVNQGTFRIHELESFFKWLPSYFKMMGYKEIKSYVIHFLPNRNLQLNQLNEDTFYHIANLNLLRLKPIFKISEQKAIAELLEHIATVISNNSDDKCSELLKVIYNAMIYEKEQRTAIMDADDMARLLNETMKEVILTPFKIKESNFPIILKRDLRLLSFVETLKEIFRDFADSKDDKQKKVLSEVNANSIKFNMVPKVLEEYSDLSDCALHRCVKKAHQELIPVINPQCPEAYGYFQEWLHEEYSLMIIATLKEIQTNVSLEICQQKVQAALKLTEGQSNVNAIIYKYGSEYGNLSSTELKLIAEYNAAEYNAPEYCSEEEYPQGKVLVRI